MSQKIMKSLPWNDALCKPGQTSAYIRSYQVHWQTPEPGCYFLQYSYNQKNWYNLNGGNPIRLPVEGLFLVPEIININSAGVPISLTDLKKLTSLYGAPEPVWLAKIEDLKATVDSCGGKRPDSIHVEYTNGMEEDRPLIWEGDTARIKEPKYTSPLIMHRADPYIYKHTDGYYYFMGSHTDPDHNLDGRYQYLYLILRRSRTINGLADQSGQYEEQIVFERKAINGGTASPHLWAPEIHFIHGKWYIYYTATISDQSSWRIRPHCLECSDDNPLTGTWIDRGPLVSTIENDIAFTDFSLDHTYLRHNGKDYISWAQKTNNISDIYIAQLSNPWTLCSPAVLLSRPEQNWEQHGFAVNEWSSFIRHGDKVFLAFSASGTDATYCMGLLSADADTDLLDPASWTKFPHPVFQSSAATGCYGPGHNSFTRSEDDIDDLIVYHARSDAKYLGEKDYQPLYDAGRNAYIGKVFWNPDGTPSFSVPGASITDNPDNLIIKLDQ